jgi:hypothetical protein
MDLDEANNCKHVGKKSLAIYDERRTHGIGFGGSGGSGTLLGQIRRQIAKPTVEPGEFGQNSISNRRCHIGKNGR